MRWIDPNGGCTLDAIEVYCDFATMETCVFPTERAISNSTHYESDEISDDYLYFSETRYEFKSFVVRLVGDGFKTKLEQSSQKLLCLSINMNMGVHKHAFGL